MCSAAAPRVPPVPPHHHLLMSSITTVLSIAMWTAKALHVSKAASFLRERGGHTPEQHDSDDSPWGPAVAWECQAEGGWVADLDYTKFEKRLEKDGKEKEASKEARDGCGPG